MCWFLHAWAIAWRQRDGAFYVRTYVRVGVLPALRCACWVIVLSDVRVRLISF